MNIFNQKFIPKELFDNIYKFRAIFELKKICNDYCLDFDKLCKFLNDNNAVIAGSCALHCIDNTSYFNDIDIFVNGNTKKDTRIYYKEFLTVFNIDQSLIDIDKQPIYNSLSDEENHSPKYLYIIKYLNKKIDMTILKENPLEILPKIKKFDISSIMFDGITWHLEIDNIHDFIKQKKFNILKLYDTSIDHIYDPWGYNKKDILLELSNNITLGLNFDHISDPFMKQIYYSLSIYYQNEYYIDDKICDMIHLYNEVTNKNVTIMNSSNLTEIYCTYRGWYYVLKYIYKGYYCENIDSFY